MGFTSFTGNLAAIDGFLKASQEIQLLSMGFSSFSGNLAVIDGFLKLPRKSSCYRWVP